MSGGFLVIEAMIAILVSIMMSYCMVGYIGKSATVRHAIYNRSQQLLCAVTRMEELLAGQVIIDQAAADGMHIRLVPIAMPMCEGIDVHIPPLAPCVQVVCADSVVLSSWIG